MSLAVIWPWVLIGLFCVFTRAEATLKVVAMQPEGCVPVAKGNISTHIEFWCQVEGGVAYWELADHEINDAEEFRDRGLVINGSGTHTVLSTTSKALNEMFDRDNITVRCIGFSQSPWRSVAGKLSYILRYGIPHPPVDLTITPTDRLQYLLEWSRPKGLQDCVPINYHVTVTNLVTNQTASLTNGSQLVSGGGQQMFEDDTEECQLHEFKVVSWNDAGDSQPEVITKTLPISPSVSTVSSSLTAVPVLSDGIQIEITFQPASSCNETRYPVVNYTISISGLNGSIDIPHTGEDVAATLTSNDFPGLQEDTYSVIVMACADFACQSADPVTVGTNHVQYANITFINTTVSLVCVFTDTSSAIGCRFQLELSNTTETVDIKRTMDGGVVTQHCTTTQNMREAYVNFRVAAIISDDFVGRYITTPEVFVTDDPADISPCELPTPAVEVMREIVEESALSDAETAAIITVVLVFALVIMIAIIIIIVWWKRQAVRNWVHHLTGEDGIDFVMDETSEKPTIMMLMKNMVPSPSTTTQSKKKTSSSPTTQPKLVKEVSHQPDTPANGAEDEVDGAEGHEVALKSRDKEPSFPPTVSSKDPVASIKIKDLTDPKSFQLLLKPATLAHVVQVWKSKKDRGDEMLLYWKENEEDEDDDEPYCVDSEDNV